MYKRQFLLTFFAVCTLVSIYGRGSSYIVKESEIPMPEVQYELPETLIGKFIIVSPLNETEMFIYSNNKYIVCITGHGHATSSVYGYIIKMNDLWFFSPASHDYFFGLAEIHLTDTGFSYWLEDNGRRLLWSIRKENLPIPQKLADDIYIPTRYAKQQYYIDQNNNRIDFNEISLNEDGPVTPLHPPWIHVLNIDKGNVLISRFYGTNGIAWLNFKGFLEKTIDSFDAFKGVIRFTNGPAYYHIRDGTAAMEMNSDNIVIKMQCSMEIEAQVREKFSEIESPVYLVLEF